MLDFPANIGTASKLSGVSANMIRHYESIGLIGRAKRTYSGYRLYAESEVHALRFIRHARDLGFPVKKIQELLGLWQNHRRPSGRVKALALSHIACLEAKIRELGAMKQALETLAERCHGDDRPECPILDGLAADRPSAPRKPKKPRTTAALEDHDECSSSFGS